MNNRTRTQEPPYRREQKRKEGKFPIKEEAKKNKDSEQVGEKKNSDDQGDTSNVRITKKKNK